MSEPKTDIIKIDRPVIGYVSPKADFFKKEDRARWGRLWKKGWLERRLARIGKKEGKE